jgi:hypothetical protein
LGAHRRFYCWGADGSDEQTKTEKGERSHYLVVHLEDMQSEYFGYSLVVFDAIPDLLFPQFFQLTGLVD